MEAKNFFDLRNPNYRGIWTKEKDFCLFYIWSRERTLEGLSGKCLEKYNGSLAESTIHDLKKEKFEISFVKKYKNPGAGLIKGSIKYEGTRGNESALFEGIWESLNSEKEKVWGRFYLADNPRNIEDLKKTLATLHIGKFERTLENMQRAFPFTPLI